MKILEVNINCGRGSTGRIVESLALGLNRSGHECRAAYSSLPLPERCAEYAFRIGNTPDVYLHGALSRLLDAHGLGSRLATGRFLRQIEEFAPDVIHLHNIHGYYLNYPMLFRYLRTCPSKVVWTLHDAWPMTGHCAYFDDARCEKWKADCSHCPQIRDYPKSWFADRSARNHRLKKELFPSVPSMTLVTPSEWLADVVRQSFLRECDVRVIHNGIDLSAFRPGGENAVREKYGIPSAGCLLLGVASVWDRRKGLKDFIRLSGMLPADCQLVLVGLTKKQIGELPPGVIGIERTENVGDLAALYSAADVYLNLTYEDNFPTTNLEALACGTPVLTYRTGGSPEAIDQSCGASVGVGDLDAVLKAVAQLRERNIPAEACVERSKLFDRSVMVERYLDLFDALYQEKGETP